MLKHIYKVSWRLWMQILHWWGITGVLHNCCSQFVLAWRNMLPNRRQGKLWSLILGCMMWSIWYERNRIKFNNGTLDEAQLFGTLKIQISIRAKELLGLNLSLSIILLNRSFDYHVLYIPILGYGVMVL